MGEKENFSKLLITWYLKNKRALPWRTTKEPYFIWLSEIILQQTKISQGTSYYLKFSKQFNTISQLASANEKYILKLWQGLGYYSRARNMHHTAKYITNELEGIFPNNYKNLIQLKGIGDYTASAILSICFNKPHAVVDGNVYRVLSRFFDIATPINSGKGNIQFKKLAQKLLDKNNPGDYNQAIMELGALICTPNKPQCTICPIHYDCQAFKKNIIEELPVKSSKIVKRKRYFNFLVILIEDRYTIITQRKNKDIWENLYEFPLVESVKIIKNSEIITSKLFQNYIGQNTFQITKYNNKPIRHILTHQNLFVTFWVIRTNHPIENSVLYENLDNFAVPVVIQKFIDNFKISS